MKRAPLSDPYLDLLLTEAEGVYLEAEQIGLRIDRAATPLAPLPGRLGEALTMLVVHEYRHLGQAARVKAAPGFPAAG